MNEIFRVKKKKIWERNSDVLLFIYYLWVFLSLCVQKQETSNTGEL